MLALALLCLSAAEPKSETLRGRLAVSSESDPFIDTAAHQRIRLDGDAPTLKILHDARVNGFDVDLHGHFTTPGTFQIDPHHLRPILVHDGNTLKVITYWCDVCYIRAYTPGPCVCCQKDTEIELRDPEHIR
jgi:hypothetical protein